LFKTLRPPALPLRGTGLKGGGALKICSAKKEKRRLAEQSNIFISIGFKSLKITI
jgi:hypothetical protein